MAFSKCYYDERAKQRTNFTDPLVGSLWMHVNRCTAETGKRARTSIRSTVARDLPLQVYLRASSRSSELFAPLFLAPTHPRFIYSAHRACPIANPKFSSFAFSDCGHVKLRSFSVRRDLHRNHPHARSGCRRKSKLGSPWSVSVTFRAQIQRSHSPL